MSDAPAVSSEDEAHLKAIEAAVFECDVLRSHAYQHMKMKMATFNVIAEEWATHRMAYPYWFAPYFKVARSRSYCTRHNHCSGTTGCKFPRCKFRHACAFCRSATHGAFDGLCSIYTRLLRAVQSLPTSDTSRASISDLESHYRKTGARMFPPDSENDQSAHSAANVDDGEGDWTLVGPRK
jgi:hypothetical protein